MQKVFRKCINITLPLLPKPEARDSCRNGQEEGYKVNPFLCTMPSVKGFKDQSRFKYEK